MDYVSLGKRVRSCRIKKKLTQEMLAEMVGISASFMGHIERGTRVPSIETLIGICKALEVSPSYLLISEMDGLDLSGENLNDAAQREKVIGLLQMALQALSQT